MHDGGLHSGKSLREELQAEGFSGDVIGVVPKQAAGHEPDSVQLLVLLFYALHPKKACLLLLLKPWAQGKQFPACVLSSISDGSNIVAL